MTLIDEARAHLKRGPILSHHLHPQIHGTGLYGRFNTWAAVRITAAVGTMTCAYVFAAIALTSLPAALATGNPTVIVNWASSNFAQLVLLPIIIVGQAVLQRQADARAEADHEQITSLHQINEQQLVILEQQTEILKRLDGGQDSVGIVRFPAPEQTP